MDIALVGNRNVGVCMRIVCVKHPRARSGLDLSAMAGCRYTRRRYNELGWVLINLLSILQFVTSLLNGRGFVLVYVRVEHCYR